MQQAAGGDEPSSGSWPFFKSFRRPIFCWKSKKRARYKSAEEECKKEELDKGQNHQDSVTAWEPIENDVVCGRVDSESDGALIRTPVLPIFLSPHQYVFS